jgi:hypothetical protein
LIVVNVAAPAAQHVTTELTSKKLKKQQLMGGCMMALGLFLLFCSSVMGPTGGTIAAGLLVCGLLLSIVTRWRIWWHHK